jgi:XTP/dITP diphosphohydrolase
MTILIATTSAHKAGEIAALLADIPDLKLETLSDYPATEAPDENGASMAENARIKANYYASHFGKTVLADDSGLEVDALDGQPGVHSARWSEGSDADRARAILERLNSVPEAARGARYRCALCLSSPEAIILETEATCEGAIALEAAGEGGFGYDPIFQITLATGAPAEFVGKTLGQVAPHVKAQVSHRARAVRHLAIASAVGRS